MDKPNTKILTNAKILWDYLRIDNDLSKSDLIFVFGNSDLRTAAYAAELYHAGYAPLIVVSGKEGHNTKGKWEKSEAHVFRDKLIEDRVPSEAILVEAFSTNTGENVLFTQQLLNIDLELPRPQSIILVQTPFMGRRCLATFMKQWETAEQMAVLVTSPPIALEDYPNQAAGYSSLIDLAKEMVGTMERIQQYPKLGFQIPQSIPPHILQAFHCLKFEINRQLEHDYR